MAKSKEVVVVVDGNNLHEFIVEGTIVETTIIDEKDKEKFRTEKKLYLNDGRIYDKWPEFMFLGNHQFKLKIVNNMLKNVDDDKGIVEFLSFATYKFSIEAYMPEKDNTEMEKK